MLFVLGFHQLLFCVVLHLFMYILHFNLQVQKNSKVYRRLSEVLGLSDESMVLSVFIRKM
jgi:hypothetical protein